MKILHTSDLHFNQRHFEWVASQRDNYDVFCMTGDFLDETQGDLEGQIIWVRQWIKVFRKPLFVCSGNHDINVEDSENWLNEIDIKNYYCDGMKKTIDGITFMSAPFENYDGFADFSCDVLLNHVPPEKSLTAIEDGTDKGDNLLYQVLKHKIIQPKVLLCGHVHEPEKVVDKLNGCTIYNPGLEVKGAVPKCSVIEL